MMNEPPAAHRILAHDLLSHQQKKNKEKRKRRQREKNENKWRQTGAGSAS